MQAQPSSPVSIRDSVQAMARGRLRAVELVEHARAHALEAEALNPLAFADWEGALQQAARLDAEAQGGRLRGPLHGIPISIKDLFNVDGMPSRGGTRAPLPEMGTRQASLVTRLREAGAVIFAKTNMHEIALGATGENLWTGDVKNPFDPARQAGGSSSGAAVCVARGIGLGAIGSDTGGSVRIPAAFCGVAGFKPTRDAIPLDGGLYLSWTCDHAGPLARSVADCALLFEVMAQRSVQHGGVARKPRLAVPRAWLKGRLEVGIREVFERIVAGLKSDSITVDDVELPLLPKIWSVYTPLVRAEAAWVHREALAAGGEGFSEMVLPALKAGLTVPAADYIAALKMRQAFVSEMESLLARYDALILPGNGVVPPLRGQLEVTTESGTMSTREAVLGLTVPFSFAGLPTLVLPTAPVRGLPTSLQIVGRTDGDAGVLALARWFEARFAAS
jgi:aspartyl-tRNA(Asn)/glutamyl-tRNA(Gln) amidotransferase subunit A